MKVTFKKAVVFFGALITFGLNPHLASAENKYLVPGDARKGWQIFSEKGCIQCHGMGENGKLIIATDV